MENPGPSTSKEAEVVKKPVLLKRATYPPQDKSSDILNLLDSKRCEGEFCDVQLRLGPNKVVYAHKALLAACCPYFEGMFMSSFMESISGEVDLSHATENPELFGKVIDTFYGHKLEVDEANVGETLNLATMLLLEDLKELCNKVIQGIVCLTNASEIFVIAMNFDLKELLDKVTPLIKARFHDYIMFQEELYSFTAEQFSKLLSIVNVKHVSRKTKYVSLLLKWFAHSESDSRAEVFISAVEQLPFKVTKTMYKELEDDVNEIETHLQDANSDVSAEIKGNLRAALESIPPVDYHDVNRGSSSSELEPEPVLEVLDFGAKYTIQGPRLEHEYTKEDEKMYKKAHEDMAERDKHREWAKRWPPSKVSVLYDSDEDPEKPKVIKYEVEPDVLRSRKFPDNTEVTELDQSTLLDGVIVLAPSGDYAERMAGRKPGVNSNMLDICVYVPRKLAWYKIGSIAINSIQKFSGTNYRSFSQRPPYFGRSEDDDSDVDLEMYMHMISESDFFGSPERLLMMRDLPSRKRRQLMEHLMRGHAPPGMLRQLIREMDIDRRDASSHGLRGLFIQERMRHSHSYHNTTVPPLTNNKWKMVYLDHKLYFYHQDFPECVFTYDLTTSSWKETGYRLVSRDSVSHTPESVDSVELVVMGKTLYAAALFVVFEQDRSHYRRRDDDRSQEVQTFYKIFKLDNTNHMWQQVKRTEMSRVYIEVERKPLTDDKRHRYMWEPEIPSSRVPDCFRTVLHVEDLQKMHIFLFHRKRISEMNKTTTSTFMFGRAETIFLDLNESERMIHTPHYQEFLGQPTPLYDNFMIGFVNHELKAKIFFDTAKPGVNRRFDEFGNNRPEQNSPFIDALKTYPLCPTISTSDGKSMWILRGEENSISELKELTLRICSITKRHQIHEKQHPPPPFRVFMLATVGHLQQSILRRIQPPCRFLQCPET